MHLIPRLPSQGPVLHSPRDHVVHLSQGPCLRHISRCQQASQILGESRLSLEQILQPGVSTTRENWLWH